MQIFSESSIAVFDLDETLIDVQNNKLFAADDLLRHARTNLYCGRMDPRCMWMITNNNFAFDLTLSTQKQEQKCAKYLLTLYNYFPNTFFKEATLIDDSLYNWNPEYTKMILPTYDDVSKGISVL
jgi:phosphoserine phosphatase